MNKIKEMLMVISCEDIPLSSHEMFLLILMEVTKKINEKDLFYQSYYDFWVILDEYISGSFDEYKELYQWDKLLLLERIIDALVIQERIIVDELNNNIFVIPYQ